MGQKVNPHGFRVGVIKDWDSRWYASEEKVGDLIVEDQKIRKYLKKTLYGAGVPKIEIERSNDIVTIYLHCARPGVVIGKGGEQIEQYRLAVEKMIGKKVKLNIVEVRNPDMNAQLVAENIAQQLEGRVSFRRAMKSVIGRTMKSGAKGIKTMVAGRLVWGAVRFILAGLTGSSFPFSAFLSGALLTAVPGILAQLILIPLIVNALTKAKRID